MIASTFLYLWSAIVGSILIVFAAGLIVGISLGIFSTFKDLIPESSHKTLAVISFCLSALFFYTVCGDVLRHQFYNFGRV